MSEENPTITNEELLKKIEILEGELDEMQSQIERALKIEKACYDLAQKLAKIHNEPLIDWWCVL